MTITAQPQSAQTVRLKDGRDLAYREYGDPGGKPVLYFHGWPSCSLEAFAWDGPAKSAGARVIAIDRPGFGKSTFKRKYRIANWPADAAELASALRIDRFAVVGISSGAPYSLVCAALIPERLTGCAVVSGIPPLDKVKRPEEMMLKTELQIAKLTRRLPWVASAIFRYFAWQYRRDPEKARANLLKGAPQSDRDVMERPDLKAVEGERFEETMRQGPRAVLASVALEVVPWGFELEQVEMPVTIWHGDADNLAFPASAHYLAEHLPNAELHLIPGAGHIATVVTQAEAVLRELVAAK